MVKGKGFKRKGYHKKIGTYFAQPGFKQQTMAEEYMLDENHPPCTRK